MKKLKKQDYINLSILIGIFIIMFLILTRFNYIYGSLKDWTSQHYIIPEYFRNLFYNTKELIPSFAFNLGAGQNIFNLAYYGLFSPYIILSYFFPFINMMYFLIGISILIVISSVVLFYIWLKNNNFDSKVSFLASFIFLLSGPLIFHSHRHIMFISYMPFLIMGLMGVDKYFKENKRILLIISIFLIIMSSYFYSVGALITLFIYGHYKYLKNLKKKEKFKIKPYLKWLGKYLINFIIPIMMASFFLLPTAYSLLNGRSVSDKSFNNLMVLIPGINLKFILYSAYSLGLSSIIIISLIDLFLTKKKENRFLVYIMSGLIIFKIFTFLLNGTMYTDGKVLIPFLPLACFIISNTLTNLFKKKYDFIKLISCTIVVILVIVIFSNIKYSLLLLLDFSILLFFIYEYSKKKEKDLIFIPIIVISTISALIINLNDSLMSYKQYKNLNLKEEKEVINQVIDKDEGFYRINNTNKELEKANKVYNIKEYKSSIYSSVSNNNLKDFYYKNSGNEIINRSYGMLSGVNNVLYNMYMGNKYMIGKNIQVGYKKEKDLDIYVNESVLPLGYASNNLMSEKDFKKLEFPYNAEAILKNIVVKDDIKNKFETSIKKEKIDYIIKTNKGSSFVKNNGKIQIRANKKSKMVLELDKPLKNKILFIKFKVDNKLSCKFGDKSITINGIKNKTTCKAWKYYNNNETFHYVISSNEEIKELVVEFSLGLHQIENIETFIMDYNSIKDIRKSVDELIVDKDKTKGDIIEGDINVSQDKYFNISIPYDKGFSIYVDEKKVSYEKTDLSFIGFKIKKGTHHIKIVFEAPLLKAGMIISIVGLISFINICFMDKKKIRIKAENKDKNKRKSKNTSNNKKKSKKKKKNKKGVRKK